jgi:putative transposase
MDFITDALASGRRFRVLSVLDDGIRKALALEVDTSLPGRRVAQVLEQLIAEHGKPQLIVVDNGPEFAGRLMDQWDYEHGIKLHFIEPGEPVQNAYVESFAGRLRDECLNGHWFTGVADAQQTIEAWRREYNEIRPHSALGDRPPEEFARSLEQTELARQAAVISESAAPVKPVVRPVVPSPGSSESSLRPNFGHEDVPEACRNHINEPRGLRLQARLRFRGRSLAHGTARAS